MQIGAGALPPRIPQPVDAGDLYNFVVSSNLQVRGQNWVLIVAEGAST